MGEIERCRVLLLPFRGEFRRTCAFPCNEESSAPFKRESRTFPCRRLANVQKLLELHETQFLHCWPPRDSAEIWLEQKNARTENISGRGEFKDLSSSLSTSHRKKENKIMFHPQRTTHTKHQFFWISLLSKGSNHSGLNAWDCLDLVLTSCGFFPCVASLFSFHSEKSGFSFSALFWDDWAIISSFMVRFGGSLNPFKITQTVSLPCAKKTRVIHLGRSNKVTKTCVTLRLCWHDHVLSCAFLY